MKIQYYFNLGYKKLYYDSILIVFISRLLLIDKKYFDILNYLVLKLFIMKTHNLSCHQHARNGPNEIDIPSETHFCSEINYRNEILWNFVIWFVCLSTVRCCEHLWDVSVYVYFCFESKFNQHNKLGPWNDSILTFKFLPLCRVFVKTE